MNKDNFTEGLKLLRQPVLPLVSMIQFIYMTGPFATIAAVIEELPEPITTDYTIYKHPQALLGQYLHQLTLLEDLKHNRLKRPNIVSEQGEAVDRFAGGSSWIMQKILTLELENINSVLCSPCDCTLCCRGPEPSMAQEFFEIPLRDHETKLFPIRSYDSEATRQYRAMDAEPLRCNGMKFYAVDDCALFHWQNGWSLILAKESLCPNLTGATGRCKIYQDRPTVCRRPQIFPYILEPLAKNKNGGDNYRIRNSILAVTDCPYVRILKEEIGGYTAASELTLVFAENKQ